mmetsp:Transcript_10801/g.22432  ORF Transcript_10801/g.22432 Transcript_10801/m.22432 type:complete len:176 (-) Transcript_10801:451-978(-)|eukprot:CAMPEP_0197279140 /NCGR_PEP_ID=MMETSP1432-20130617/19651_1 /TAXON_ID=44447 /ORGANISM="Pseudo-nitzschia delicatissima, Strain UNC1205" /LENGTH=175 /DNA_ID=CAMNT_0042745629 /DNA_START=106 /DNA_END=633 /DNA_ORIENTATION=-
MERRESTASGSNVLLSVEEILGLVMDGDEAHNSVDASVDAIDENKNDSIRPLYVRSASSSPSFVTTPPAQRRAQTWHAPKSPSLGNAQEQITRSRPSRPSHHLRSNTNSLYLRPQLVETHIAPFETTRKEERKEISFPPFSRHPHAVTKEKKAASRFEIFENKLREEEGTSGLLW